MTSQQMVDFDARREAVIRRHLKSSPKFRALRRDRHVAFATGVIRYFVAVGISLFLVKAFVLSQAGVDGYVAIVAPLLTELPQGGLLAKAVAPDAYSLMIADTFAVWMDGQMDSTEYAAQDALEGFERIGPATQ